MAKTKFEARRRRKVRIRIKVKGTAERPRLSVFRSARHISAQIIDDETNRVLAAATTQGKANDSLSDGKKIDQAKKVGTKLAELCRQGGVEKVVFDRGGYKYHGRVKALAAAAREAGLKF